MNGKHINLINVHYSREQDIIPVGRLAMKDRRIYFEYLESFIESGLQLSPFKLPLKAGIMPCNDHVFDGLFGLFNDSLPDGWGRLLLDRKLKQLGLNPDAITPLDRLSYTGSRGMGALRYEPEVLDSETIKIIEDLDQIAKECQHVAEYDDDQFIDDLLFMNGSSAGARPKILVSIRSSDEIAPSSNDLDQIHNDWIVKFRSSLDPKDIGPIEYAYNQMAVKAGLEIPEVKLFKSKVGSGYFGVKRFDRVGSKFIHMHTISGLLHADHRFPTLDYQTVLKVTALLTKNHSEVEKQFRRAVFNVLSHNRDDHAKNFSFLMDENGNWIVSPAYDLTFSSGPGGEHCTTVMGEGRAPTESHLLDLAKSMAIKDATSKYILDQVKSAILLWPKIAKEAGVTAKSLKYIQSFLS